ncbi:MAG TPA: type II secretion system F family protein [Bryobacteraceae bacterium]|nr:type II secretion system F family protein [Bryobacteraceae bacterium]
MALVIFIFGAVVIATVGGYFLLDSRLRRADLDTIKSRLLGTGAKTAKNPSPAPTLMQGEDARKDRMVLELLRRFRVRHRLQELLERAGLRWPVVRLARLVLTGILLGFSAAWYSLPSPLDRVAFLTGPLCGAMPLLYVWRKSRQRLRKFEAQFPEGLEFVARAMRAGHAFSVSLEMLHHEFDEPLAGEFRRTFDEQNLGLPLEVALEKLARRVPLLDVQFFVSAVLLQKRTGGNLAEVLEKLAYLIRERFKLRGRIRAISAHGRMTGTALSLIPAAVAAMMFYVNPQYVLFFIHDTTGQWMMGGAIGLQLVGYAVIKKIVSIEV